MKLLHWTVFVDLLGYRELNGDVDNEKKAKELIEFMNSNKKIFEDQTNNKKISEMYKNSVYNLYEHYSISFAFISDSLVISYTPNLNKDFTKEIALMHSANSLLIILQRLRALMYKCVSEKKIFLRGGVSNNYSYISGNFAVGSGVGSAYIAEMQAKYPRVILAEDVAENIELMGMIDKLSNQMYGVSLIKDDGKKYLDFNCFGRITLDASSNNRYVIENANANPQNYMENIRHEGGVLRVYKEAIEFQINKMLQLKNSENLKEQELYQSLKEKYLWLSNYHNNSCDEFSRIVIPIYNNIATNDPKIFAICQNLSRLIPAVALFKINDDLLRNIQD
jgi:hypothetical protein